MNVGVLARRALQLEAPHVVTEIGATHEPGVGQVDEVAVDRGAIEAEVRQLVRERGMRHR